jgi:hypothetical protein
MANIPDFTDLANYRYNAFTNTVTPKLIGYKGNPTEDRTIPTSAPYTIILHESPQLNVPSTTSITDTTTATVLEEVSKTTTPGNNQYRVNYDERGNGQIEFNANQKTHSISIKYYGEGSIEKKENYQSTINEITQLNIINIDTDTTLDVNTVGPDVLLLVNPSASRINITLYGLATNSGNKIRIVNINNGIVRILRGGSDTIDDGISNVTEISTYKKGDFLYLFATASEWIINRMLSRIDTGYINWSDWTNVHLGTVDINVNAGSNPLGYEVGELVSGAGGAGGRILRIQDNLDGTGIITVYQCTAGGNFINGNVLTGANSLATANINGNTKNVDVDFYHGNGIDIEYFDVDIVWSTDATGNNSFRPKYADSANNLVGTTILQVDTNSIRYQTGGIAPVVYIDDTSNGVGITIQDWYSKQTWKRTIGA